MGVQSLRRGGRDRQDPRIQRIHCVEATGKAEAAQHGENRQAGAKTSQWMAGNLVHDCVEASGVAGASVAFGAMGNALWRRARPFSGVGSVISP